MGLIMYEKRFSQEDINAIWFSLCSLSMADTAKLFSINKGAVSRIASDINYKKESSLVDPAIRHRAKHAIESRLTSNRKLALKIKREVPATDTLVDVLREHGTKVKAAKALGVRPEMLSTWMRLRHIEQSDYKDPAQSYRKIDADDVLLIRELSKDLPVWDIAKKFEITVTSVCDIVCRRVWRSI